MSKEFLKSASQQFLTYKKLGEKSFDQLSDEQLFYKPNEESNSIAIIVKHLHGNMLSRWTDFLTTDGEKEWRKRDEEFEDANLGRTALLQIWEEGWKCLFDALNSLTTEDFSKTAFIRKEPHTITDAIHRQLAHYAYHVGQIVYIGKILTGSNWKSLSIPKKIK